MKLLAAVILYLVGSLALQALGLFVLDALDVISLNVRWPF